MPAATAADISVTEANGQKKVRILVRGAEEGAAGSSRRRMILLGAAAFFVLAAGLALGWRGAELMAPPPPPASETSGQLTERVRGGLYALELATPRGQARWMLEFDAEIVTNNGPSNPIELRNALEDLVINATSLPLVQSSDTPEEAMRSAMLAMATQSYPWLVDLYMTRSDMRAQTDRLGGIGRALRSLNGE